MLKKWSMRKNNDQYLELSNLDQKHKVIEEQFAERPWYLNFSLQTWRPVVWAASTQTIYSEETKWLTNGVGVTASAIVLSANLILLFVGISRQTDQKGTKILFQGDCKASSQKYTAWHLLINVLSTLLLGASNAASQILAAPTRAEIDHAHSQRKWVHIGVFDFLNLRFISWKRIVLCGLIALSSIPLHLLYNSAVFNTTSVFAYYAFMVTPSFVTGGNFSVADTVHTFGISAGFPVESYAYDYDYGSSRDVYNDPQIDNDVSLLQQQAMNGSLLRLNWQDCITQFSTDLMSKYSAVLLVTKGNPNVTNSFWTSYAYYTPSEMQAEGTKMRPYSWVCSGNEVCEPQKIKASGAWNISRIPSSLGHNFTGQAETVDYCLARGERQACAVDMSINLMITVIVCNVVKLGCFLACLHLKDHIPVITVGDAVGSFLTKPDPNSIGLGPVSSREVRRGAFEIYNDAVAIAKAQLPMHSLIFPGKEWSGRRHKYYSAVSLGRWVSTGVLSGIIITVGVTLLVLGLSQSGYGRDAFNSNLGLQPSNILPGNFSLFSAIFSANIIQLAVSTAYLLINNIFTCALLSKELADYATQPKLMRVTRPRGPQRSSYWLQLPYRWSLPLMAVMTLLHWLISEALFMVDVQVLSPDRKPIISADGYSAVRSFYGLAWGPTATLCAIIEGFLLVFVLYTYGFRKFTAGVPVFSSCSIAISAACHPSTHEYDDAIFRPLKYGVLSTDKLGDAKPVGFSSLEVTPLQKGEVYGGRPEREDSDPAFDTKDAHEVLKLSPTSKAQAAEKGSDKGVEKALLSPPEIQSFEARSRPGWRRLSSV